eukprot:GHVR01007891.1.p1 GENE.GHVR01007891.1~~GHVR01007891.1.p1  ORF type:complete len:748 (-),score=137.63 GHVR01007891.1:190-2160(-)
MNSEGVLIKTIVPSNKHTHTHTHTNKRKPPNQKVIKIPVNDAYGVIGRRQIFYNMSMRKITISAEDLYNALPTQCNNNTTKHDKYHNFVVILIGISNTQVPNYHPDFIKSMYPSLNGTDYQLSLSEKDIDHFWESGCGGNLINVVFPINLNYNKNYVSYKQPLVKKEMFKIIDKSESNSKSIKTNDPWNIELFLHTLENIGRMVIGTDALKHNGFNEQGEFLHFYHQHGGNILHRNNPHIVVVKRPVALKSSYNDSTPVYNFYSRVENALINKPLNLRKSIDNTNTIQINILGKRGNHTCIFVPNTDEIVLIYKPLNDVAELTQRTDGCIKKKEHRHEDNDREYSKYECWNMNKQTIFVTLYRDKMPVDILDKFGIRSTSFNCIIGTAGNSAMFYDKVFKFSKLEEKVMLTIVRRAEYESLPDTTKVISEDYTGNKYIGYLKNIPADKYWITENKGRRTIFNLSRVRSYINMSELRDQLPPVCDCEGDISEWGTNCFIVVKSMYYMSSPTKKKWFLNLTAVIDDRGDYIVEIQEDGVDKFWEKGGCGEELSNQIITIDINMSENETVRLRGPLLNNRLFHKPEEVDLFAPFSINDEEDPWYISINLTKSVNTIGTKLMEINPFNIDGDFFHMYPLQSHPNMKNNKFNIKIESIELL